VRGGTERTFWLLWGVGLLSALGLSLAASVVAVFPGDEGLAHRLQGLDNPFWERLVSLANSLGGFPWLGLLWAALVVAFVITRRPREAAWLSLAALLVPISAVVKLLVGRPRPSPELVSVQGGPTGASFPSSHTFGDVLLFGSLFFLAGTAIRSPLLRFTVQGICLLAMAMVGLARVYVGAHWPSDVLGSYLLGGLVIALLLRGYRRFGEDPGRIQESPS